MVRSDDPRQIPEWRAIALECKLVRQLCGAGLTSLGRANYADGMGEYYSAFFSLSVGIERFCKIILCFDEEQKKKKFPSQKGLKSFGHDLVELFRKVRDVEAARSAKLRFGAIDDPICDAIILHLSQFANAGSGRYANFLVMESGRLESIYEPVSEWSRNVGDLILEKFFRGSKSEILAYQNANLMDTVLSEFALVRHTSETGQILDSLGKASFRTSENIVMQKYGRFYSFRVLRFLADLFYSLTSRRGYEEGGELWFGHYEHFNTFTVPDEFGLRRKIWPLT